MLALPERQQPFVDSQQAELDAIIRNEQQLKAAQAADRKRSYIEPGIPDVERQVDLVRMRGFEFQTNPDGSEVIDILWPSPEEEETDYRGFVQVAHLLWRKRNQSDKQFFASPKYRHSADQALSTWQQVEELLMGDSISQTGVPFFRKLHDPSIPVTKAHTGRTPAAHILDVLECVKSDHLQLDFRRFLVRVNAVMHDWGKLFISGKDIYQDHAHISYYIARKFLARYFIEYFGATPEIAFAQAATFTLPIKYHHLLEQVEENILTEKEAAQLLPSEAVLEEIATLTIADRLSVRGGMGRYAMFAFLVFFGYPHLLKQIVTTEEVLVLAQRLSGQCLGGVADVLHSSDEYPNLIDSIALPVINGIMNFQATSDGLVTMLSQSALGTHTEQVSNAQKSGLLYKGIK
jgi:hypothetical protein